MTVDVVSEIVRAGLYTIIKTSAPVLLLSLIVGLIVSIFQTATSIQEQTLTFVPKIVAVFLGIMLFGGWMLNEMVSYMVNLWSDFTLYIK
ncbi:MAG: flagellar biosynthesis protein FliQ [Lachnospiraceae bacterium]|nr:flagellar biosynthesis protein FliQ [Lachnospiraceae bacterium]MDD3659363.1 flagellar biosynthesis protein FliQ [Lachnospiraceae bacterium]